MLGPGPEEGHESPFRVSIRTALLPSLHRLASVATPPPSQWCPQGTHLKFSGYSVMAMLMTSSASW